ncbi:MAG TPA: PKD domain-containing protein [Chitinophagaceae bacterium]|nr:PKD domain-containing protein [Chitinophagaceae bacterium]
MKKTSLFLFIIVFVVSILFFSCEKEISCEGCSSRNKYPIAVAGQNQIIILPTDSVLLDGNSSSDPDGMITKWHWEKISGPASFNMVKPSDSVTKVKTLAVGSYQFKLTVTDNDGLSAKDTVEVIVKDSVQANRPPAANAGDDQTITLPTNTTTINGDGSSDPDNNIIGFAWTKISGPSSFTFSNPNIAQTQVANLVQGVYAFELKVTDAGGLFSKDTMQVTIITTVTNPCINNNRPLVNAQLIPVGSLSQARTRIAVASAGNKIVFAGGYSDVSGNSSRVDIYDTGSQTWSVAELSEARADIAAVAAGDKIFFAGGRVITAPDIFEYFSTVDFYDATTNTWSVRYLTEARSVIAAAAVGNKVFFAGGSIDNNINWLGDPGQGTSKVDIYDLNTQTWSTATLSEPRGEIAAVTLQNKIYFAGGGNNDPNSSGVTNRIDIYDDDTGSWSISSLQEPRTAMASIAVDNKIYWAGGLTWPAYSGTTCSVEIFDINNNSTVSNLHRENWWSFNAGQRAVLKDNKIVFCIRTVHLKEFDIYDINTNSWSIGVFPVVCHGNSIISVNNTIYIAGGLINGIYSSQVWKLEF